MSAEKVMEVRATNVNCSQSVLGGFCEECGITMDQALKLGAPFGAGARCGELCGAVAGGLMALGLMKSPAGRDAGFDAIVKEYTAKFTEKYGYLRCQDLKANKVSCNELIYFAGQAVEEIAAEK